MATKKTGNKIGRPTNYTLAIAEKICDRLAAGDSLEEICRANGIHSSTVRVWRSKHPEFEAMYAHAREAQGDYYGERVASVGRRCETGEIEPDAARVSIDAYKWTAARMSRARWGDRAAVDVGGEVVIKRHIITEGDD